MVFEGKKKMSVNHQYDLPTGGPDAIRSRRM